MGTEATKEKVRKAHYAIKRGSYSHGAVHDKNQRPKSSSTNEGPDVV
jgi:uncharacterized protein (DUF2141 family)